jgi:hypothetical protein
LECSFHGYDFGEKSSIELSVKDYQQIGNSLGKTIYEYHMLSKQLEKETASTNGWLKPGMLMEVTGVPAAEIMAQEIKR